MRYVSKLMFLLSVAGIGGAASPGGRVDQIVGAYTKAVGGEAAVNRIQTREIEAKGSGRKKLIYYWRKPDQALLVDGKAKTGWDGGSGWELSSKKRVSKLAKGAQRPLQIDANPLRYVQFKQLYPDAESAPPAAIDGVKMDVIVATNDRGVTKFYFDAGTHLLANIVETGDTSAYFEHSTSFSDYQEVDGVKLPFRIVHSSNEPGAKAVTVRILKVMQDVPVAPELFVKPANRALVLGGKK